MNKVVLPRPVLSASRVLFSNSSVSQVYRKSDRFIAPTCIIDEKPVHGIVKWPICFRHYYRPKSDCFMFFRILHLFSGWRRVNQTPSDAVGSWFSIVSWFGVCKQKFAKRAKIISWLFIHLLLRKFKFAVRDTNYYLWAWNQNSSMNSKRSIPVIYLYFAFFTLELRFTCTDGSKLYLEGLKADVIFWQQTNLGGRAIGTEGEQKACRLF